MTPYSVEQNNTSSVLFLCFLIFQDILVNPRSIEQWSFSAGSVFVADHTGNYAGTVEGTNFEFYSFRPKDAIYVHLNTL